MLYKMTAIGRMTAIGYRPATGCNIYIKINPVVLTSGPSCIVID